MTAVDNTGKDIQGKLGRYLQDFYRSHLYVTKNNWSIYIWIWHRLDKTVGAL